MKPTTSVHGYPDAGSMSVVVPFHARSPRRLVRLLSALQRQRFAGSIEIVIADDASPGPKALEQACQAHGATYVRSTRDPSFPGLSCRASALNAGIAASSGRFVQIIDQDILLTPGHIQTCVNILAAHGEHTACHAPRGDILELLLQDDQRNRFSRFHLTLEKAMALLGRVDADEPVPVVAQEAWDHVVGHNLFFSHKLWEQIGPFEESFVGYGMEDLDYAYRLNEAGVFLPHLTKLRVYHIGHARPDWRAAGIYARNVLRFFERYPQILETEENQLYEWAKVTLSAATGDAPPESAR